MMRAFISSVNLLVLAGVILLAMPLYAEDDGAARGDDAVLPIKMKTKISPHEVYPGDEIRLEVTFTSDRPFSAEVLGSLSLGKFDLKDRDKTRGEEDGKHFMRHVFTLVRFDTGQHEVPRIPFNLRQGGKQEERKSELLRVTVKSLLEEEARKLAIQQMHDQKAQAGQQKTQGQGKMVVPGQNQPIGPTFNVPSSQQSQTGQPRQPGQPMPLGAQGQTAQQPPQVQLQPRDIKGPLPLVRKDYTLLYIAGGVFGVLLLGLVIWLWMRRERPEPEELPPPVDTRPAHLVALERLDALEAAQLVAKRRVKDYHIVLSEILHDYFGKRYNVIDALSLTSEEMLAELKNLYLRDLDGGVVGELLFGCDMVKFAKDEPTDDACRERMQRARMIIERTKEIGHELR